MSAAAGEGRQTQRLDKWLWSARFLKTRGAAARLVAEGRVRLDGEVCLKPHRAVGPGDTLTFPQGRRVRVVRILALAARRGPAPEAQALYSDLSPEAPPRPSDAGPGAPGPGESGPRPTGRDRRALDRLRGPKDG